MKSRQNRYIILIDCPEEIPCNPCETVCPKGKIEVGQPLTNLPTIVAKVECTGCGMCVAVCPGHAIFLVDQGYSEECFTITIPYEFREVPQKGDVVSVTDQDGNKVCGGQVVAVKRNKAYKQTTLIAVALEKKYYALLNRMKGISCHG